MGLLCVMSLSHLLVCLRQLLALLLVDGLCRLELLKVPRQRGLPEVHHHKKGHKRFNFPISSTCCYFYLALISTSMVSISFLILSMSSAFAFTLALSCLISSVSSKSPPREDRGPFLLRFFALKGECVSQIN